MVTELVEGALLSGGVAALVFLATYRIHARLAAALSVAAGYAAGLLHALTWPDLPLASHQDGWLWIAWFCPAGLLAAGVEPRIPRGGWRLAFRLVLAGGATLLVLRPLAPHALGTVDVAIAVAAGALLGALLWGALARGAFADDEILPPAEAFLLLAIFALSGCLALLSGSLVMARAGGALGVALLGATLAARIVGAPGPARGAGGVLTLPLTALVASAVAYLDQGEVEGLPVAGALSLALGLLAALEVPRRLGPAASARKRLAAGLLLVLLGIAGMLALVWDSAPGPDPRL